ALLARLPLAEGVAADGSGVLRHPGKFIRVRHQYRRWNSVVSDRVAGRRRREHVVGYGLYAAAGAAARQWILARPSPPQARPGAPDGSGLMDPWRFIADRKIREAMDEGKFDRLDGKGRPLPAADETYTDPSLWMAHHVMKNNGIVPPWVAEGNEIEAEIER